MKNITSATRTRRVRDGAPCQQYPRNMKRQSCSFKNYRVSKREKPRCRHDASCIRTRNYRGCQADHTWANDRDRWKTIAAPSSVIGAHNTFSEVIDSWACGLVCLSQQPQSRVQPRVRRQPQPSSTYPLFGTTFLPGLVVTPCPRFSTVGHLWSPVSEWNGINSTNDGHRKVGSRARI